MIINIYMFNDHLLFSNNINDAANQLRNIQLQQLEEEKYKKLSIQLQEQVNKLETFINLIESGQYLSEADWRQFLGRLAGTARSSDEAAEVMAQLRKGWRTMNPDAWQNVLNEMKQLGFIGAPLNWTHPTRGSEIWILRNVDGGHVPMRWNGQNWVPVRHGRTPWGRTQPNGNIWPAKGQGQPNPQGGWYPEGAKVSAIDDSGAFGDRYAGGDNDNGDGSVTV